MNSQRVSVVCGAEALKHWSTEALKHWSTEAVKHWSTKALSTESVVRMCRIFYGDVKARAVLGHFLVTGEIPVCLECPQLGWLSPLTFARPFTSVDSNSWRIIADSTSTTTSTRLPLCYATPLTPLHQYPNADVFDISATCFTDDARSHVTYIF